MHMPQFTCLAHGKFRLRIPRFRIDQHKFDCRVLYFIGMVHIIHCAFCGEWVPDTRFDDHLDWCIAE